MTTLNNIQIIEASRLQKVTYAGVENNEYDFAHIQKFFFELNSNTDFKFRIVFKISHYADKNIVTFYVEGQQFIGSWETGTFYQSIPSTTQICDWAKDDFNAISTHLLNEIENVFPTCEFRILSSYDQSVKNNIIALQENAKRTKKLA